MKISKFRCIMFIGILFFVLYQNVSKVQAEDGKIIPPAEIIDLVDGDYIPEIQQLWIHQGDDAKHLLWKDTYAGEPVLQWSISTNTNKPEILNWVVPINNDDYVISLIGIDPFDGTQIWRLEDLPADFSMPSEPSEQQVIASINQTFQGDQFQDRVDVSGPARY